jgi:hypothetical protein
MSTLNIKRKLLMVCFRKAKDKGIEMLSSYRNRNGHTFHHIGNKKGPRIFPKSLISLGVPKGIRTPVAGVKGS